MLQALSPPKRYRGFVLTAVGQQKLQSGIQKLQAQTRVRQNSTTIAEQVQLIKDNGIHPTTVRKILRGQQGVDKRSIADVFEALQLTLTTGDCAHASLSDAETLNTQPHHSINVERHETVSESFTNPVFYGRTDEITQLRHKIIAARCRIVAIVGVEGIGKTALMQQFVAQHTEFECCVWQSLHPALAIPDLVTSLWQSLTGRSLPQPTTVEALTSLLLEELKQRRCLLVLDGFESILENRPLAGYYRAGYEGYGEFFRAIAEQAHQSCVVFTSQVMPKDFKRLEGERVQAMYLEGLNALESQQQLQAQGIVSRSQVDFHHIKAFYGGNPLILKWLSSRIQDYFDGNLSNYLGKSSQQLLFQDLWDLLNQQFDDLSDLEQHVMIQLAINSDWVSLATLQFNLVSVISQCDLLDVIDSLHRRSMLQKRRACFKLSLAMAEFIQSHKIAAPQPQRSIA